MLEKRFHFGWVVVPTPPGVMGLSGSALANEPLNIEAAFQKPASQAQSAMVKQDRPSPDAADV